MERRRLDTSSEFGPKVVFVRLLHVGTASQVSRRGRGILIRSKTIQERLSHTIHSNPSSPCKQRSGFWNIRCHVLLLLRHIIIIQFRFKGPSVRVCVCGMKTTISHFNHMRAVLLVNHNLLFNSWATAFICYTRQCILQYYTNSMANHIENASFAVLCLSCPVHSRHHSQLFAINFSR